MRYIFQSLIFLVINISIFGCHKRNGDGDPQILSGNSMGTTWTLAFRNPPIPNSEIRTNIQSILDEQESIFSLWNGKSILSKLNKAQSGGSVHVPAVLVELLSVASDINIYTEGAYDITVSPLVDLWGYGPGGPTYRENSPDATVIQETLGKVGMDKIQWSMNPPTVIRQHSGVQLDFNSLAKGNCLDIVATRLHMLGLDHFVFELGGEVLARGHQHGDEGGWPVGIQSADGISGKLAGSVRLINSVLATSGTYHQYGYSGGIPTTHIIDPRNGYPVSHTTVSVSVIAEKGADADAWATALLVLGEEKGRALTEKLGIKALFISK